MGKKDKKEKKVKKKKHHHKHHRKDREEKHSPTKNSPPIKLDALKTSVKLDRELPKLRGLDPMKLKPLDHLEILNGLNSPPAEILNGGAGLPTIPTSTSRRPRLAFDNSVAVTSRKTLNAVYSGHSRAKRPDHVPSLTTLCQELLKDHLDIIECLGDMEYFLVKPVLDKCTPAQLARIEKYNSTNYRLLADLDALWKAHCISEFKDREPGKKESWRDFYFRLQREREEKLGAITKQIKKKTQLNKEPVRKAIAIEAIGGSNNRPKAIALGGSSTGTAIKTAASIKAAAAQSRAAPNKPAKKAPLMAKMLSMMKNRFRR